MASSYLGPESPRPLAVISESFQHRFRLPEYSVSEKFTFGDQYDEMLFQLVHKYTGLGTTDKMCYIGDAKGSLAEALVNRFCIMEPMLSVIPGHYSYVETDTNKMLPIRVAHVGAEEFFRLQAKEKPENRQKFDAIIIKDALRYFEDPTEMYGNIMKCLSKNGKMLIIHRPSAINTLPVFRNAKQRLEDNEIPYTDIIKDLQSCDFDVQWEIETLPILMSKKKWFAMLKSKFPPQMEIMTDFEMRSGVRELSEGILKYEGDVVEFNDRLLFIAVSNPIQKKYKGYPNIKRYGANDLEPFPRVNDLNYSMEVSDELKKLIEVKQRNAKMGNDTRQSGIF